MPLDWLNAPIEKGFGDLIARRRYSKAIEVLRAQILGRTPTTQERLQLADLLLLAGRRAEALPILLGLADEFAADGFAAKAVAVLKRVEKIEPGRPDVESRLASLVQQPRPQAAPATAPRAAMPTFGIEEIEPEGPQEAQAGEPAAGGEASGPDVQEDVRRFLESLDESALGPEPETAAPPEPGGAPAAPAAESTAAPGPEEEAGATEEKGGVTKKIRGVFRRFLTSIAGPDAEEAAEESPPPAASEPASAEEGAATAVPASAEISPEGPGASPEAPQEAAPEAVRETTAAEPAATAQAGAAPQTEAALEEETAPEVETEAAPAATQAGPEFELDAAVEERGVPAPPETAAAPPEEVPPEARAESAEPEGPSEVEPLVEPEAEPEAEVEPLPEPLSEDAFQEQVLDLIQDALEKPPPAPRSPEADVGARTLPLRRRPLLASPLFDDLSQDEMLAVLHGLKLHTFEAGDVIVTEGEPGASLFILSTGVVRVFVRNPAGRDLQVGRLQEGDFFGEISSLSGRPRTATITAASPCELLELEKSAVDSIARSHPRVREMLEAFYVARASSPEAAAVRAIPLADSSTKRQALDVLEAHFGESRWDPRMRLRLAELLLKVGKDEDAVPVLIGLADDLARQGYTDKAVAMLKKIERIRKRHLEEINLAPLGRKAAPVPAASVEPAAATPQPPGRRLPWAGATQESFKGWIVDVLRDQVRVRRGAAAAETSAPVPDASRARGYARGLRASPLFEGFGEEELLAVIRGLRLLTPEAGEILITEGEPGESLFVLASGAAKVFVRDARGHNVALATLREGSFFGEISTLSSRPRTATVTAAARCELLELDKATLEAITARHPRVRSVLEEFYIDRAGSPEAARIRATGAPEAG